MREGNLVSFVAGAEQKLLLDRIQATMALIEGHAEHVMDAVGADVLPSLPRLRAAMDRRRESQGAIARLVARLIGLDLKLRQYVVGKRFCDAVVERGGRRGPATAPGAVAGASCRRSPSSTTPTPGWRARRRRPPSQGSRQRRGRGRE